MKPLSLFSVFVLLSYLDHLKLLFRSQLIDFLIILINSFCEGICVEFERKKLNIGFPTFKLPSRSKIIL